ncbi:hypothetical protein CPB86DRAFT_532481 [Serendipita vermifera]|nr:hypothetical protein CPB86DRAFT_532481 [Serendipita vermifera]
MLEDKNYIDPAHPIIFSLTMLSFTHIPVHWKGRDIATMSLAVWTSVGFSMATINTIVWCGNIRNPCQYGRHLISISPVGTAGSTAYIQYKLRGAARTKTFRHQISSKSFHQIFTSSKSSKTNI